MSKTALTLAALASVAIAGVATTSSARAPYNGYGPRYHNHGYVKVYPSYRYVAPVYVAPRYVAPVYVAPRYNYGYGYGY